MAAVDWTPPSDREPGAMPTDPPQLLALLKAIAEGDTAQAFDLLAQAPQLAGARLTQGATRQMAKPHFWPEIQHYVYAGDTPLHLAAAAYQTEVARRLIDLGADLGAANRRGAQPLHYA